MYTVVNALLVSMIFIVNPPGASWKSGTSPLFSILDFRIQVYHMADNDNEGQRPFY